jgi:Anticodon binding domain
MNLPYAASQMISESSVEPKPAPVNLFAAADVAGILREHGWLQPDDSRANAWIAEAVALLGPRAANREALGELLAAIFEYDARAILSSPENHAILAREGSREVLRGLATEILSGGSVDSNRLKEIVAALRRNLPYGTREIFHPLRLALAGRVGGGELDRVILLLDSAAEMDALAPVKSVRTRILEFCSALD